MGFFEPPPPPPEPPRAPPAPDWVGPPDNVLPGSFPLEELLVRTAKVAVQVHTGRAYPNGFEFAFTLRRREARQFGHRDDPLMRWHHALAEGGEIADDVLRFGIELADGRKATVFDRFRGFGEGAPAPEVVLQQRGGGGGSNYWEFKFWAWPLPPPGPFVFVVEWPSEGIELTRVEIDSGPIRDASTRAEQLWPEGGGDGGWSHTMTQMSS